MITNQSTKIRVAIIGAGKIANTFHYPSLKSFKDVEITAICDINQKSLHDTADKYEIENRYNDYKQMIKKESPDAVYAIGQPHIMYDVWKWCLEQGLNLYIEKPLGLTIHQARSLTYLAEKNNCITQVSYQRRNSPILMKLKEECLKKGSINHAVCRFYKSNTHPFLEARDYMMDDCVHSIDTLRWICGGEVVKVESFTKRIIVPNINFITASLYFDNGSTGTLINNWISGRRIFSVEIHAPSICAEINLDGKGFIYSDDDTSGIEYDAFEIAKSQESYIYSGVRNTHREFIVALKNNRQSPSNFADALKTMEVAEEILAQSFLHGR